MEVQANTAYRPLPEGFLDVAVAESDRNSIFSLAEQEQLVAAIKGARLDLFSETGHAIHWEDNERFVRQLMTFAHSLKHRTDE